VVLVRNGPMSRPCCKELPSFFNGSDLVAATPRDTQRDTRRLRDAIARENSLVESAVRVARDALLLRLPLILVFTVVR
jgi:hypothetical protein